MNPVSLMADAGKLSIGQLQQAVKNGTIPAYIGIPMMQEKMKQAKQAQPTQAPTEPPIAQQVMAEASGIDQMPSNLPTQSMNDGGIVSFADGGDAEDFDQEEYEDQRDEAEYAQAIEDSLNAAEHGSSRSKETPSKTTDVNRTPSVEGGIKAPAGDFYKNMYGVLKAKAEEMGFKNPEAIARVGAAQSALETGYGKALAGGNNYFGIKGSGGNKQSTKEYSPERGYYNANESFRTYNGMEDSAADYLRLMQNPRYAKVASAQTPEEAIEHQSRSGYATSPKYGSSLRAIHSANMAEGGIARLNHGGVAHFYGGGANDTRTEEDKRLDEILSNLQDPTTLYPEKAPVGRGAESSNPFVSGRYLNPNNLPRATDAQRTQYLQHALSFGEDGVAGALNDRSDRLLPAGVRLPNVPAATASTAALPARTATPRVPSFITGTSEFPEEQGMGGMLNQPDIKTSSASGVERLDSDTTSSGSSSTGGAKQKSEYDLIREDIMSQREELKRQKQEDKYMAILQAGLGMMAGTSPNAMANIGQGASAGIAQYGASGKQRAAENAALNKGLITAQRYRSMDENQRAALADRASGRADIIADRAEGRADTLSDKGEARTLREKQHNQQAEGQIDLNIAARQKAIESMVQAKLSKLDPLGSLSGDQQMQKFNQMVQEELAKDIKEGTLKNLYERKKYYQKQNWGIDFEMPNYGAASTSAPSGVTVRKVK